ncbi:MAG: regulatory protein RecX [Clostridia bacterium]|nr:regulatory protein RecX [Clostridia bacterium]
MNDKIREEVLNIALLSRRTEKQIIEKLVKKGYDEEKVREATEYYRDLGYIDHADYARRFVSDSVKLKGYGPERIKRELIMRGVEAEIAENALDGIEYDLPALVRKKFKSCSDEKERQKIINYFIRRGFSYYETADAVKEVFE